jgi:hypothetical protein
VKDPRNADVLFPLLGGEELNESPIQVGPEWVINFFDWSQERAREYPDCYAIVEEHVKPQRARNNNRQRRELWWKFTRPTIGLYRSIENLNRFLVTCQTSKLQQPAFVRGRMVLNNKLVIFPYEDDFHFGVLSSMFHWRWVLRFGSTLRTDPVYTPSDVFDTFPQPALAEPVAVKARALNDLRATLMVTNTQGLTATYNRFHNPEEKDETIERLREAHIALDYSICDAYGWREVLPDLKHGFHEVRLQGDRFTFAPDVADEVIDLLLEENKRRYESEVQLGVQPTRRIIRRESSGDTLFDLHSLDEVSDEDDENDEEQE